MHRSSKLLGAIVWRTAPNLAHVDAPQATVCRSGAPQPTLNDPDAPVHVFLCGDRSFAGIAIIQSGMMAIGKNTFNAFASATVLVTVVVSSSHVLAETLHGGPLLIAHDIGNLQKTVKRDTRKRRVKLEKACSAGNGNGCFALGQAMAEERRAVEAQMRGYYSVACTRRHAQGCYEIGRMLMNSENGPNADKAIKFFERGCEEGSVAACYSMAELLREGELVPQNLTGADVAEKRAAELLRLSKTELTLP